MTPEIWLGIECTTAAPKRGKAGRWAVREWAKDYFIELALLGELPVLPLMFFWPPFFNFQGISKSPHSLSIWETVAISTQVRVVKSEMPSSWWAATVASSLQLHSQALSGMPGAVFQMTCCQGNDVSPESWGPALWPSFYGLPRTRSSMDLSSAIGSAERQGQTEGSLYSSTDLLQSTVLLRDLLQPAASHITHKCVTPVFPNEAFAASKSQNPTKCSIFAC